VLLYRNGAQTWSITQADKYLDILSTPEIGQERTEFEPPIRIHIVEKHLIIYRINDNHLSIIRVLGGRQNWQSILNAIDQ